MGVRAVMSLKIALSENRDKVTVVQVAAKVLSSKVFLGLVTLGVAGTITCRVGFNYVLINLI